MFCKKTPTLLERYERIKREIESENLDDPVESNNLYSKLNPMLFSSELIYGFAQLRQKAKREVLEREDLILPGDTTAPGETEAERLETFSQSVDANITVQDIAEFTSLNLEKLNDGSHVNSDLFVLSLLALSKIERAHLVHFDADYSGKTFVYALLVNHDQKRITAVFRGSQNVGDWISNVQFLKDPLETPKSLVSLGFDESKKIKVHGGLKDYVFYKTGKDERQKYSQIKNKILNLYQSGECDGYELFVTGHSLGGAVSSMVAFELAASQKIEPFLKGKPVVNITFASLYVGGKVWGEAFELLEKAGRIQHIRVSNKKDLVPVLSPTPDFRHVGVNLYLDPALENKYEFFHWGKRSLLWQWSFTPVSNHVMQEYYTRCKSIGPYIGDATIDEIYKTFSITNTD